MTMKGKVEDADGRDQPRHGNYSPTEAIEWIRIWLTQPNRERSKFTDIATVVLTLSIAIAAFASTWIVEGQRKAIEKSV